ncbi:MAG: ribosome-associated translation inhibitor RaiA [Actinobacteria bacterium]|nr:ribosome-associated translation inhibitor RaiA [Actinomycetota bacterium]
MDVKINGRRMEVSDKLRMLTEDKVGRLGRVVEMDRAEVLFTQAANPRIPDQVSCEITLDGQGHHVRAKVAAAEGYTAIDKAVTKASAQLKKLKSKLRSHRIDRSRGALDVALDDEVADDADAAEEAPRIVKSKRFAMMPMTPEDAVGRMELLGHGFFFFTSADTGRAAVIYRRADGDVGLIDEAD